MSGYLYLASPYSHEDPMVREQRFLNVCYAASRLIKQGYSVFAPIAHSHPIAEVMGERATDHEFWMAEDLPILAKASKLVILKLPGWEYSKGIAEESDFARANGIPIEHMAPTGEEWIEDRVIPRMGTRIPRLGTEGGPHLPTNATQRKGIPLYSGLLRYFPDACIAVAELSRIGNDQHNPGQPLYWDRFKSTDEPDALMRHLVDAGTMDVDGVRHSTKVAWRALANLQKEIEAHALHPDA